MVSHKSKLAGSLNRGDTIIKNTLLIKCKEPSSKDCIAGNFCEVLLLPFPQAGFEPRKFTTWEFVYTSVWFSLASEKSWKYCPRLF